MLNLLILILLLVVVLLLLLLLLHYYSPGYDFRAPDGRNAGFFLNNFSSGKTRIVPCTVAIPTYWMSSKSH